MKQQQESTVYKGKYGLLPFLLALFVFTTMACSQNTTRTGNNGCNYVRDGFGPDGNIKVQAQTVVSGLEVPWAAAFLPNGDMLVTERPGRIRLVKDYNGDAQLVQTPVAAVSTANTSEGGLLGIAIHPDFQSNRLFYIYVTVNNDGNIMNQVEQWRLSDDGMAAEQVKVIFKGIEAATNHNGGRIAFGPDNMLYIGTGDAGTPDLSQNPDSPNGKLLRLSPEGEIPDDNPRAGNPMFLMGLRNTQGWAWPNPDDANTLWVTDHGPSGEMMRFGHDEVNIVSAGDNLGWPTIYKCETESGLISPSLVWQNAVPPGGAAIYTGEDIPEWKGNLIIGTLGSRHLHRAIIENGEVSSHEVYFRNRHGRLREVIMSPEGNLYITTSNCDGRGNCPGTGDEILRITR